MPLDIPQTMRLAAMQDAANGLTDMTAGKPFAYAIHGDDVWTARIMATAGSDLNGVYYEAGDVLLHRCHWSAQSGICTLATSSAVPRRDGTSPWDAARRSLAIWASGIDPDSLVGIEPDRPVRLALADGTLLHTGWEEALSQAEDVIRRSADPDMVRRALLQDAIDRTPKPCSWWIEDYGYGNTGLYLVAWHRDDTGRIKSADFTHFDYDGVAMRLDERAATERPQPIETPISPDDQTALETLGSQYLAGYQAQRNHASGAPEGFAHPIAAHGITHDATSQPLLTLADGHVSPSWTSLRHTAAAMVATGSIPPARRSQPTPPTPPTPPAPTAPTAPHTQKRPRLRVTVPASLVHPYRRQGRDGRVWDKMIVNLPRETRIDGRAMGGWSFDRFASPRALQAKQDGQDVTISLKEDDMVDVFRGHGTSRRSMQVPARALVGAIHQALAAQAPAHATEPEREPAVRPTPQASQEPLTAAMRASLDALEHADPRTQGVVNLLAAQALETQGDRVDRLADRLDGYRTAGTYQADKAVTAMRRIIDRAAIDYTKRHGQTAAAHVADTAFTTQERSQAALLLLAELSTPADPPTQPAPYVRQVQETPAGAPDTGSAPPRKTDSDRTGTASRPGQVHTFKEMLSRFFPPTPTPEGRATPSAAPARVALRTHR